MIIQIGNAYSRIRSKNEEVLRAVSDILSYEMPGASFATRNRPGWDGRVRLLKRDGSFPTGLLRNVLVHLKKSGLVYQLEDSRNPPAERNLWTINPEFQPRPYQKEAVEVSNDRVRGVFLMATGAGKSFTSACIIANHGVPSLFVTPNTGLREQAAADFRRYFIDGEKLISTNLASEAPIVVSNIQALAGKNSELFKRFRMLLIDEFHHGAAKSYLELNQATDQAYYRYGLTGTFMRSDGADMPLFGVLSDVVYRKSTSDLIEEGWLVRPTINVHNFDAKRFRNLNYRNAYDAIIEDEKFLSLVVTVAQKHIDQNHQTLVLVRRKEQGVRVASQLSDAIFLCGDDPLEYREKCKAEFAQKKIKAIVATEIFGEGTDIPTLDALVNARLQKTEIQTVQGIGRVLRRSEGKTEAWVDDFCILHQRHLYDHSLERIRSFSKEKAFKINHISEVYG